MEKTMNDYLSKGCDLKVAEYFVNGRKKIIGVVPKENFTLLLKFDNGEQRIYDVRPLLRKNTVFEPFMNYEAFRRVYIDQDGCIAWDVDPSIDSKKVWNNKVDLCADSCYLNSYPLV